MAHKIHGRLVGSFPWSESEIAFRKTHAVAWSPMEEKLLNENYSKMSKENLISMFPNRNWHTIRNRAHLMGLSQRLWNEHDAEIVKKHFKNTSREEIMQMIPDKSWSAIRAKAFNMSLKRDIAIYRNQRSSEEDLILKNNYHKTSNKDLTLLLPNRSYSSNRQRAYVLGINQDRKDFEWSDKENEFLKNNYHDMAQNDICSFLKNRNWRSINTQACELGLQRRNFWGSKDAEEIKKRFHDSMMGKFAGDKNPAYINGQSKRPYPNAFYKIAPKIRQRDSYTCQNCGKKESITYCDKSGCVKTITIPVHHIDHNHDNNDPMNLITLCTICNEKANPPYEVPYWKKYYQDKMKKRFSS